ncbi:MAG: cytochrome c biogenesis protein CcdA [Candidatus Omnitrophota bacterium]
MIISGSVLDFSGAFVAGVVMSLTPCVYPLVPVTAAVIGGANVSGSRRQGFFLSLLYVLGMALSYAALALFAAMTGKIFGMTQNSPLVLVISAVLFILFALVLFDCVRLPSFSFLPAIKPHNPWAVFVMGAASGLMIGPCTTPALGALLVYATSEQSVFYAAALLFVFAYGLGMSLILAGTLGGAFAARPRSGVWMEWIKKGAGVVLLLFAGYYLLRAGNLI